MTEFIKKKEVKKNWYKIDATNLIVGRLASEITKILRGKKKLASLQIWMMGILS